jgi:hypothetical protein
MTGANPRVTAILNLLTKGFGYFYLGDRGKGIACFLAMSAVQALLLLHANVWTQVLAISLQVAVALDGYRVARERLLSNHPELRAIPEEGGASGNIVDRADPGSLKPTLATALFTVLGGAMLIAYAALLALNGHPIKTAGTLEQGPEGLTYRDIRAGIELTVPEEWIPFRSANSLVALRSDGAALIAEEKFATYAADSMLKETEKDIQKLHPEATFTLHPEVLAHRPASGLDTSFNNSEGVAVHQRFIAIRRGMNLFIVIESWTEPEKRDVLDKIEQSIRFQ